MTDPIIWLRSLQTPTEQAMRDFAALAAEAGLVDVAYRRVDGPLGSLLIAATRRGVVRLAFPEEQEDAVLEELSERVSPRLVEAPALVDEPVRQLDEYLAGGRTSFDLPIDYALTSGFRDEVLRATARIPYGRTSTYLSVAAEAGSPRGARAVGRALSGNPVPIIIPCHRVIGSNGSLIGFGGGLELKAALLRSEGIKI